MKQPSLEISQTKAQGIHDTKTDGVDSSTSEIRITILASTNPFTQVRQVLLNHPTFSVGGNGCEKELRQSVNSQLSPSHPLIPPVSDLL